VSSARADTRLCHALFSPAISVWQQTSSASNDFFFLLASFFDPDFGFLSRSDWAEFRITDGLTQRAVDLLVVSRAVRL
jgi:hypothetical protein